MSKRECSDWRPEHVMFVGFDGLCVNPFVRGRYAHACGFEAKGSSTLDAIILASTAPLLGQYFMGSGIGSTVYYLGLQAPDLSRAFVNENGRYPDIFWHYHKQNPDAEIGYIFEWDGWIS
jgi:hypothetical protein